MGSPKLITALRFQLKQPTLNRANTGGADIAILHGKAFRVITCVLQHGAQIFQIKQQQAIIIRDFKHQIKHACLGIVQIQHACQQQRPHIGNSDPQRMALFTKHIPQCNGTSHWLW